LKSLPSKAYFFSLCGFGNFYIQKIMSWERWKIFFSLCWFV